MKRKHALRVFAVAVVSVSLLALLLPVLSMVALALLVLLAPLLAVVIPVALFALAVFVIGPARGRNTPVVAAATATGMAGLRTPMLTLEPSDVH